MFRLHLGVDRNSGPLVNKVFVFNDNEPDKRPLVQNYSLLSRIDTMMTNCQHFDRHAIKASKIWAGMECEDF